MDGGITQRLSILIATQPVDFRCGHQALALMVQTELKLDPHSGITVIFRSKRGDRLKILVWDGTGYALPDVMVAIADYWSMSATERGELTL
ncbi:IS66 family insertion sequence element accessory protein TnpB [Brucella sp. NBRC 13694]|uniref:IS66 family insertion sequence element accessory protein TnpB n=1 Tax=Brucella sp. NBRC 13694 TaxID=3075482 RepID=UPI00124E87C4|nr:IS66 family insertion sequence element accessory protein TnpB [Brucella anthropi]